MTSSSSTEESSETQITRRFARQVLTEICQEILSSFFECIEVDAEVLCKGVFKRELIPYQLFFLGTPGGNSDVLDSHAMMREAYLDNTELKPSGHPTFDRHSRLSACVDSCQPSDRASQSPLVDSVEDFHLRLR